MHCGVIRHVNRSSHEPPIDFIVWYVTSRLAVCGNYAEARRDAGRKWSSGHGNGSVNHFSKTGYV